MTGLESTLSALGVNGEHEYTGTDQDPCVPILAHGITKGWLAMGSGGKNAAADTVQAFFNYFICPGVAIVGRNQLLIRIFFKVYSTDLDLCGEESSDVDVRPSGNLHVRKCGSNIVESPLVEMVNRRSNKMLTVSISITVFNTFSERSDIVDKELAAAPINIAKRGSGQALVGVAGATKNYVHQITKSIRPNVSTARSTAPFSCSYVGLRGDAATSRSLTDFIRSLLETVATAEIR
ncbi:hypothetical protein F5877DRAFT_70035 [Lentinula edodes]|nr:hypothetical protein F5877DRAFT_70035 [Lentinula edodes]